MHLNETDLMTLAGIAAAAAQEAGALIAQHNGSEVAVQYKEGGENLASQLVTVGADTPMLPASFDEFSVCP